MNRPMIAKHAKLLKLVTAHVCVTQKPRVRDEPFGGVARRTEQATARAISNSPSPIAARVVALLRELRGFGFEQRFDRGKPLG